MKHLLKKVIDQEFASNGIDIVSRVEERAWQFDKATDYQIKLLYRNSQLVMEIFCHAQRPYTPKIRPVNVIEPYKMIRLCEIVIEAFKELERKSEEGESQFR